MALAIGFKGGQIGVPYASAQWQLVPNSWLSAVVSLGRWSVISAVGRRSGGEVAVAVMEGTSPTVLNEEPHLIAHLRCLRARPCCASKTVGLLLKRLNWPS